MRSLLLIFIISLVICSPSYSQISWLGTSDSNWNNPLNWNPATVPDSLDDVNIILNASSPQPNWPSLQQPSKAGRLRCENAEIRFNGNKLRAWEFNAVNSIFFGGADTSTIELRLTQFGIILNNCTLNGDFKLISNTSRATFGILFSSNIVVNGNFTVIIGTRTVFNVWDSLYVSGNLAIRVLNNSPIIYPGSEVELESVEVGGDFSLSNLTGGFFTWYGGKIRGKINIDNLDRYPTNHWAVLFNVSNLQPNGKIRINGARFTQLQSVNFVADSIIVSSDTGRIIIDSSEFHGPVDLHSGLSNRFNSGPNRLSGNKFFNTLSWIDTTLEIEETRGSYLSLPVKKAPNNYFGDVYFKGKVDLGNVDTSSFHGNLVIEPLNGSIFRSARFAGNRVTYISIGETPIQYIQVDKTLPGTLIVTSPLNISGEMRFENGVVETPGSYLHFLPGSSVQNFRENSYVNGDVRKEGNNGFTFPVGSATQFKPFSITAPSDPTDIISIQYKIESPILHTDTSQRISGLNEIGNCEYWDVKSLSGTPIIEVSAAWDPSCLDNAVYFTNPADAQLARWDGAIWQNEGNGGYTNGSISSFGPVPANGLFTFASPKRIGVNPEPPRPPTMVVYPNPVRQILNIVIDSGYKQGMIIDAIGRTIAIYQVQPGLNSIDVSRLPSGVYFFKMIAIRTNKVVSWIKL